MCKLAPLPRCSSSARTSYSKSLSQLAKAEKQLAEYTEKYEGSLNSENPSKYDEVKRRKHKALAAEHARLQAKHENNTSDYLASREGRDHITADMHEAMKNDQLSAVEQEELLENVEKDIEQRKLDAKQIETAAEISDEEAEAVTQVLLTDAITENVERQQEYLYAEHEMTEADQAFHDAYQKRFQELQAAHANNGDAQKNMLQAVLDNKPLLIAAVVAGGLFLGVHLAARARGGGMGGGMGGRSNGLMASLQRNVGSQIARTGQHMLMQKMSGHRDPTPAEIQAQIEADAYEEAMSIREKVIAKEQRYNEQQAEKAARAQEREIERAHQRELIREQREEAYRQSEERKKADALIREENRKIAAEERKQEAERRAQEREIERQARVSEGERAREHAHLLKEAERQALREEREAERQAELAHAAALEGAKLQSYERALQGLNLPHEQTAALAADPQIVQTVKDPNTVTQYFEAVRGGKPSTLVNQNDFEAAALNQ